MRRWMLLPMLAALCAFESFETQENAEQICRMEGWDASPALFADCIEYRYQYNAPKRPGRLKMGVADYVCQRKRHLAPRAPAYDACVHALQSQMLPPLMIREERAKAEEAARQEALEERARQKRYAAWVEKLLTAEADPKAPRYAPPAVSRNPMPAQPSPYAGAEGAPKLCAFAGWDRTPAMRRLCLDFLAGPQALPPAAHSSGGFALFLCTTRLGLNQAKDGDAMNECQSALAEWLGTPHHPAPAKHGLYVLTPEEKKGACAFYRLQLMEAEYEACLRREMTCCYR